MYNTEYSACATTFGSMIRRKCRLDFTRDAVCIFEIIHELVEDYVQFWDMQVED